MDDGICTWGGEGVIGEWGRGEGGKVRKGWEGGLKKERRGVKEGGGG